MLINVPNGPGRLEKCFFFGLPYIVEAVRNAHLTKTS